MASINYALKARVSEHVEWEGNEWQAPALISPRLLEQLVFLASQASPELIEDFKATFG